MFRFARLVASRRCRRGTAALMLACQVVFALVAEDAAIFTAAGAPASLSTASVLRVPAFAAAFDQGNFLEPFPPIVVVDVDRPAGQGKGPSATCAASWESAKAIGDKMDTLLQDVGFHRFFASFYANARVVAAKDITAASDWADTYFFFPFCGWAEIWTERVPAALNGTGATGLDDIPGASDTKLQIVRDATRAAVERQVALLQDHATREAMLQILSLVPSSRAFFVATHPMMLLHWMSVANRVRALRVDATTFGSYSQVNVPYTTKERLCPLELPVEDPSKTRPYILSISGHPRGGTGPFEEIRRTAYAQASELQRSRGTQDLDADKHRDAATYDRAFFASKFCAVLPGDTQSTSQASHAMCGGCVPVFVSTEFRDMPFANILDYDEFSLRLDASELLREGGLGRLYDRLHSLVASGAYERMRQHVPVARSFFNYHRFDAASPYGAAIASMVHDEQVKYL